MVRLVLAPERDGEPMHFLSIDAAGEVIDHGTLNPGDAPAGSGEHTVFVVPGAAVLARWLDIPARTETQARAAAALLIESEIATPKGRTHIALGPRGEGDERLVAAVDQDLVRDWLALAAKYGVHPDALTPDCLLLPEPSDPQAVIAVRFGAFLAVRGRCLAFSCEPELAARLLTGRQWRVFEDEWEAERLVVRGGADLAIDLLQGPFAPQRARRTRSLPLAAGLVLIAAALALAAPALEGVRAMNSAHRLEAQGGSRAARIKVAALRAELAGGFPVLAGALFAAMESQPGTSLESLSIETSPADAAGIEAGPVLRARLRHRDAGELAALMAALNDRGVAAAASATVEGDGFLRTGLDLRAKR